MLKAVPITADQFQRHFPSPMHPYNSVPFTELNRHKVEEVMYLALTDEKNRTLFGIILGKKGSMLLSPFSAPFGGIESARPHGVGRWIECAECLRDFALATEMSIHIAMPPAFYCNNDSITAQSMALEYAGFCNIPEYNYHFELQPGEMSRAARKNLATAERHNFTVGLTDDVERAYKVIEANRREQGYPLRMTLSQVLETVKIVKADFWVVSLNGTDVAAAQIFHLTPRVVQVIYWGDLRAYSAMRPMNLLASEIARYYRREGKIVDVGPSSSGGVPSTGLCDFKSGVGCRLTPKNVFTLSVVGGEISTVE